MAEENTAHSAKEQTASVATPGPAVDLIEHAAGIIVAKMREPHTAPYHWAGALWESGMLVAPGAATAGVVTPDPRRDGLTESTNDLDGINPSPAGERERTDRLHERDGSVGFAALSGYELGLAEGRDQVAEEIAQALGRLEDEQVEQMHRKHGVGLDGQAREHAVRSRAFRRAKEIAREHVRSTPTPTEGSR